MSKTNDDGVREYAIHHSTKAEQIRYFLFKIEN